MDLPDFIKRMPALDLPFPSDVVKSHALVGPEGLLVFFEFMKDMVLPPHAHGDQWGTVLEGEIEFTIGDETRTYGPGDSYYIPAGVMHGAKIPAGVKVIDCFEETDRYKTK